MPFMDEISSEEFRIASRVLANLEISGEIERYGAMRAKQDRSPEEERKFIEIDSARRTFTHLFGKMWRLHKTGVVDDQIVRAVVGPDMVWTLLFVSEPLEQAVRKNYNSGLFEYFAALYPFEEIEVQWPRNANNSLPDRILRMSKEREA